MLYDGLEHVDLPRSTCPGCGYHVRYDPQVVRDGNGKLLGIRIQALACDFCRVRTPLPV